MDIQDFVRKIALTLNLQEEQVRNTLDLLNGGATIPFISRYRKEATGSLDEVQIEQIKNMYARLMELEKRRAAILDSIREQGKLTPELEAQLQSADSMSELEDLYLPFRPKRKTRASVAVERGLEPLAKILSRQQAVDMVKTVKPFINPSKDVPDEEAALAGARDILAERLSENVQLRAMLRNTFRQHSRISTKQVKDKVDENEKFKIYYNASEFLPKAPSHRILAMLRG